MLFDSAMSEATFASVGLVDLRYLEQLGLDAGCDDHLCDTFAREDGLRLPAKIDEDDTYLTSVVGIDGAGRIEDGKSAFECQSATGSYLCFVAFGQFDEETCWEEMPLEGLEGDGFGYEATDVHTGGLRCFVLR